MWRWVARLALVLIVAAGLVGCKSDPAFVGTWRVSGSSGETLTIGRDGSFIAGMGDAGSRTAQWKLAEGDVLEIHSPENPQPARNRWTVSEDGKTLTLTPVGAETGADTTTFTRQ
ncbi:MAG: hypothetical protein ACK47B_09185 [Armatimonadota bacterium]